MSFSRARWIAHPAPQPGANRYYCFRQVFEADPDANDAELNITASARYFLWLNGEFLGRGPVRGWTDEWFFDTYQVGARLRRDRNVLAVLVRDFGIGTFQHLPAPAGLLAELLVRAPHGEAVIGSDRTWRVIEHPAYRRHTPRIDCQQPHAEEFDARLDLADWQAPEFNDENWVRAGEIGPAGCAPWTTLQPRDIPFLGRERAYPARMMETSCVRDTWQVFAADLRPYLLPDRLDANRKNARSLTATVARTARPATLEILLPDPAQNLTAHLCVNGEEAAPPAMVRPLPDGQRRFDVPLRAGENLVTIWQDQESHDWMLRFAYRATEPVELSVPGHESLMAVTGPWGEDPAGFRRACRAADWDELSALAEVTPLPREQEVTAVTLRTALAEAAAEVPHVDRAYAALNGNDECAVVHPGPQGTAVRLVLAWERYTAGRLGFELEAPAGAVLEWCGVETCRDGQPEWMGLMENTLRYTTRQGWQRYESVTPRGFRYQILTIRELTAPLRLRSVFCAQETYPVDARGEFRCNDLVLQRAYEISCWTTRMCSDDTFVDCPGYEQTFWVGDSLIEGAAALAAFGSDPLVRRCLLLAAKSLRRSPLVESQVPSAWQNLLPAWSFLWVLACEDYYQYSGDRIFLEAVYPFSAKQAAYCTSLIGNDGLVASLADWWSLLDWAPMDTPDYTPGVVITHLNALLVAALERTARMATLLGREGEADDCRQSAARIRESINKYLWSPTCNAFVDCRHADGTQSPVVSEQTNTVCYLADVATPERSELIARYVSNPPAGFVRAGSPFMLFFVLAALDKQGRWTDLLQTIRRFWGVMIEKDSTTCWETLPGFDPSGRWSRSYCHAWSAAPAFFLPRVVLGVQPAEAGFGRTLIAPHPGDLTWAAGRVPTPRGEIEVEWEADPRRFTLAVRLPNGVGADLRLPAVAMESGEVQTDGQVDRIYMQNGSWWVVLAPGARAGVSVSR